MNLHLALMDCFRDDWMDAFCHLVVSACEFRDHCIRGDPWTLALIKSRIGIRAAIIYQIEQEWDDLGISFKDADIILKREENNLRLGAIKSFCGRKIGKHGYWDPLLNSARKFSWKTSS